MGPGDVTAVTVLQVTTTPAPKPPITLMSGIGA